MKKNTRFFYAAGSALLLWLAWPPFVFAPLLFIAFVPLLMIEDELFQANDSKSSRKLFGYTFLTFAIWNIADTWWIWNAAAIGMIMAFLLNAFLMSLPFFIYHKSRRYLHQSYALMLLVASWLAYEYFHLHWDLSWPWMTLGNGFAKMPSVVQWYEYTGVFGGSLWVLAVNVLLYRLIRRFANAPAGISARQRVYASLPLCTTLVIPVIISLGIYFNYEEPFNPSNIVIVQPNIDPYNEKFDELPAEIQIRRMIHLSDSLGQKNTEFFLWPETALQGGIFENDLSRDYHVSLVRNFITRYKNGNVLTGASTYMQYEKKETPTARVYSNGQCCYDAYNTALFIESFSPEVQVYHKSKLVPGVEQMPYPGLFRFLEPLAVNLGGTSGSLGKQEEPAVFHTRSGIAIAPVICYESIYGEYLTEYVRKGAQFIAIVTNDGWWGNTPGYMQHADYARLRAIETRRSIARSANTGISCFINQRGDITAQTGWWTATAIKGEINLNDRLTFYSIYGDYIGKAASALTLLSILFLLVRSRRK